jgi:hypothetical protein
MDKSNNLYSIKSITINMNNLKPIWVDEVERSDRKSRFRQTNSRLDGVFENSWKLDPTKVQLVVSRGAFYLLDEWEATKGKRKVILSSNGKSEYSIGILGKKLKLRKSGDGIIVWRIFDITETTLEAAFAIVLANRYWSLREEQIKIEERDLLWTYGYMLPEEVEYAEMTLPEEEKLAA